MSWPAGATFSFSLALGTMIHAELLPSSSVSPDVPFPLSLLVLQAADEAGREEESR